jgi:transcriptional antiterminator RfaH
MRQWFVLYTKRLQEVSARRHLEQKGCGAFLPMLHQPWRRRGRTIEPLFPNYLFVHIRYPEEARLALWTPGMQRFVSFGAEPVPVDAGIIDFLREKAGTSGIIEARTPLEAGDQVRISEGPFEGLMGIIKNPPDAKGRVLILMNILNQAAPVSLPAHWVQGSRPPELCPARSVHCA